MTMNGSEMPFDIGAKPPDGAAEQFDEKNAECVWKMAV
jgi:hypothetical protein